MNNEEIKLILEGIVIVVIVGIFIVVGYSKDNSKN